MAAVTSSFDVVIKEKDAAQAAVEICVHLAGKGFCVVDPGLGLEPFESSRREAETFLNDGCFTQAPALITEGLLGSEGSAQIYSLEDCLGGAGASGLTRIDEAFGALAGLVAEVIPSLGFRCPQRSLSWLHETGLPADSSLEPTEREAETWLPVFQRGRILVLAILGPIKGTLELNPLDPDAEPFELATVPGSFVLLRADQMTHKHFSHSQAFVQSCWLIEPPASGVKATLQQEAVMAPWAIELENWMIDRMQELKEQEDESGRRQDLPDGWRAAMDRMFHTEQRAAVRGIAGRFCSSWKVDVWAGGQVAGSDLVTPIPLTRWSWELYYDPDPECWRQNKCYLMHGSFADGMELFDCRFFTLSPMESQGMDPHQRQVLEVGYEACRSAGYPKGKLMNNNAGIYLGSTATPFVAMCDAGATGGAASINANRFSYCLGLKGPSMTVDTENASSLTAVHLGADATLEKGRGVLNNFSLVGGVNVIITPLWWPQMQSINLLSKTGRCLAWDSTADGYAMADGTGMAVLKRYTETKDGQRDYVGDEPGFLYGVVAASNMNSNGLTAAMNTPHGPSLQELITDTVRNAHISPSSVDAVEVDGRGAYLMDAVETDSVARALRGASHEGENPLLLTSTKSLLGNAVEAAGIASLLRVMMGTRFSCIAPNCHLNELNPYLDPAHEVGFATEAQTFPYDSMYVGVGASGFGGTNVHVLTFGQPDTYVDLDPPERKPMALGFWPGGGGELEDNQIPLRGYSIAGTWSNWTATPMEKEGDGVYGYTATLGENLWEDFQLLLDGKEKLVLHPGQSRAPRDSPVYGPDENPEELKWRIDGRPRKLDEGQELPSLPGLELKTSVEAKPPAVGEKYRIRLQVAGKFRMVSWERLPDEPVPESVPKGSFYLAPEWNGWKFVPMTESSEGWTVDTLLLNVGGDFQVVRNQDWSQAVAPAWPSADRAEVAYGPDETFGSWRLKGAPGDVVRISLKRKEEDSWTVDWEVVRKEELTEKQREEGREARLALES